MGFILIFKYININIWLIILNISVKGKLVARLAPRFFWLKHQSAIDNLSNRNVNYCHTRKAFSFTLHAVKWGRGNNWNVEIHAFLGSTVWIWCMNETFWFRNRILTWGCTCGRQVWHPTINCHKKKNSLIISVCVREQLSNDQWRGSRCDCDRHLRYESDHDLK